MITSFLGYLTRYCHWIFQTFLSIHLNKHTNISLLQPLIQYRIWNYTDTCTYNNKNGIIPGAFNHDLVSKQLIIFKASGMPRIKKPAKSSKWLPNSQQRKQQTLICYFVANRRNQNGGIQKTCCQYTNAFFMHITEVIVRYVSSTKNNLCIKFQTKN